MFCQDLELVNAEVVSPLLVMMRMYWKCEENMTLK